MFTINGFLYGRENNKGQVFFIDRVTNGHIYFENRSGVAVTVSLQSSDAEAGTYTEFDTIDLVPWGRGFHTMETDDLASPFILVTIGAGEVHYNVVTFEPIRLIDPRM